MDDTAEAAGSGAAPVAAPAKIVTTTTDTPATDTPAAAAGSRTVVTTGSNVATADGVASVPAVRTTRAETVLAPAPWRDEFHAHAVGFFAAIAALNVLMIWLIRRVKVKVEFKELVAEKDPAIVAAAATAKAEVLNAQANANLTNANAVAMIAAAPGGNVAAANVVVPAAAAAAAAVDPDPPQSTSRIVGLLGGVVLVALTWGLSNFVVWAAFFDPARIQPVLDYVGQFYLAGSALFAPYAFNQLGSAFKR